MKNSNIWKKNISKAINISIVTGTFLSMVSVSAFQITVFAEGNVPSVNKDSSISVKEVEEDNEDKVGQQNNFEQVEELKKNESIKNSEVQENIEVSNEKNKINNEKIATDSTSHAKSSSIEALTNRMNELTWDDILVEFGGRHKVSIPDYKQWASLGGQFLDPVEHALGEWDINGPNAIDTRLLDEQYVKTQEQGSAFIERFLSKEFLGHEATEEDYQKVDLNLKELIYFKTYLDRWYNFNVGDQSFADLVFFNSKSIGAKTEGLDFVLEVIKAIKTKDLKGTNTASNGIDYFYKNILASFFPESNAGNIYNFLRYAILMKTGSDDYDQWFRDTFTGYLYESKGVKESHRLFNSLATNSSLRHREVLFQVLSAPNQDKLMIGISKAYVTLSTKDNYDTDEQALEALSYSSELIDTYMDFLEKTHPEGPEFIKEFTQTSRILFDRPELQKTGITDKRYDYMNPNNALSHDVYLANNFIMPTHALDGRQGSSGTGYLWFGPSGRLTEDYLITHELTHQIEGKMLYNLGSGDKRRVPSETLSYEMERKYDYFANVAAMTQIGGEYANNPGQFQTPQQLSEYVRNYIGLNMIINAAYAETILAKPIEDQVGYIVNEESKFLSAEEIEKLNLTTVYDLISNRLDLASEKNKLKNPDLFKYGFYTGTEEYLNDRIMFYYLIAMEDKGLGSSYLRSYYSGEGNSLDALKKAFDNPTLTFEKFYSDQMKHYLSKLDEHDKYLKLDSYEMFIKEFSNGKNNSLVRNSIGSRYFKATNQLEESIFLNNGEIPPPKLEKMLSTDTIIEGVGVARATVIVEKEGKEVGKGVVDDTNNFKVEIGAQEVGTRLTVKLQANGIESSGTDVIVTQAIEIKSEIIAKEISKQLVIKDTHQFDQEQLNNITEISFSNVKLNDQDLADLSKLEQLTKLELFKAGIEKIEFLKNLTHLKVLFLDDSKVGNIEPLSNLVNLEQLSLQRNKNVVDLTPLKGLFKLKKLWAAGNKIKDVTPLSHLRIEFLDVSNNQISDITFVKGMGTNAKNQVITLNKKQVTDGKLELKNTIELENMSDLGPFIVTPSDNGAYNEIENKIKWSNLNEEKLPESLNYQFIFGEGKMYSGKVVIPIGLEENKLEAPIVNSVLSTDKRISGKSESKAIVMAKVAGKEIGKGIAETDGSFELNIEPQKSGTKISVTQTVDGYESPATEVTVEQEKLHAYNTYKLGYWRDYGFVLEGQSGIFGEIFTSKSDVVKTVELVNTQTNEIELSSNAVNTNWYDLTNYDGYQAIITNDMIEKLVNGNYRLQVKMTLKDGEIVTQNLAGNTPLLFGFIGEYQETISGLGKHSVGEKVLQFNEGLGQVTMNVAQGTNQVNVLNSRVNVKEESVLDLWIASKDYDYQAEHTKYLVIKDNSGKEVYNKKAPTWDIKKTFKKQVKAEWEKSGVQAIVPKEYRGASFTKEIQVKDKEEQITVTTTIPQELLK